MKRKKAIIKDTIISLIPTLNSDEIEEVAQVVELSQFTFHLDKLQKQIREARYSEGVFICPTCHGTHIVKNGKKKGVQRYMCRGCKKSFSNQTATPTTRSKKSPDIWLKYIKCMMLGYSIRKAAVECEINIATSFFWRHKILDALFSAMGVGSVDGLAEGDETFFRVNKKGNRTKKRSYKKGVSVGPTKPKVKIKKKRGLSDQQVNVGTALDRLGNLRIELICKGKLNHQSLKRFYTGHVAEGMTLCTDSAQGYKKLSKELNFTLIQIESGKRKRDIYHIQHVNSLHGRLKTFMVRFRGVSTKHLQNYLNWFKFIELFKEERESKKVEKAFVLSQAAYTDCSIKAIKNREPAFV